MIFVCLMHYVADKQKISDTRPRHRIYAHDLIAQGKMISGGSFLPDDDGGMFLYEAESLDEAKRLFDEDPYVAAGVVKDYMLKEYQVHGVNIELLRPTG